MNEERLEINKTETDLKTSKTAGKGAKEILGSLELTVDFMEGVPENKRWRASRDLVEDFVSSSGPEINALAKEKEGLYIKTIQGGLDGLFESQKKILEDNELTEEEKKEKMLKLNDTYKCAQQLRQMTRAQALDRLLADFLNPYLWTAQGGETYGYDAGFATATTWDEKTEKYKSHWEPKVNFHKHLGDFLSESDTANIRKFIEGFFEQHHQVDDLAVKVAKKLGRKIDPGYDPRAAEAILSELDQLPTGLKLSDRTRVVICSHTVSVILSHSDYGLICGSDENKNLKSSSGVHFPGTVLNLINNLSSDEEKTICHENEHALNDKLLGLHQTGLEEETMWRVSLLGLSAEKGEQELENLFEQLVQDLLYDALGRDFFFTRFADEVLANKLGNKDRANETILDILNNGRLYDYLHATDDKIGSLCLNAAKDIEDRLQGYSGRMARARPGVLEKMAGQIPTQLFEFLRGKGLIEIRAVTEKLLDKSAVYKMREEIIKQIDRLIEAGFPPEKVRALLSTTNPLTWKNTVNTTLAKSVVERDRKEIKTQLEERAEKNIKRARAVAFEDASKFSELTGEQKENFKEIRDVVAQLTNRGFELQESVSYSKDKDSEFYRCHLRKIVGQNSCNIVLDSGIEHDRESGKNKKSTFLEIDASGNKNFNKYISFEDNNGFTLQNVKTEIEEAEKEAGIE